MRFAFSHQIPLSKFGLPAWPQADTISVCGIFPAFLCLMAAKPVPPAEYEPALQKRQLCSVIESLLAPLGLYCQLGSSSSLFGILELLPAPPPTHQLMM